MLTCGRTGTRIKEICYNLYTQRLVQIAFWCGSAPAIFQHTMENILQGIPDVLVYLDDILVAGSSEARVLAVTRDGYG